MIDLAMRSPDRSIRTISGNLSEARSHPNVELTAACNIAFLITGLHPVKFKQNKNIHDVEVRIPEGFA
jgi:hypothetical protein